MELWDAYKADGTLAGSTLIRGEKIPEGLYHGVAEVFVLHEDGTILLMLRDKNKPNYPGYWESGASGSILKGESFELGARRELLEETGIISEELTLIYEASSTDTLYKGYLCLTNVAKDAITLQEGETIDYKWVAQCDFKGIFESDSFVSVLKNRLEAFVKKNFDYEQESGMKELTIDLQDYIEGGSVYKRTAVRGIIQKKNKFLLIHSKYGDHKFPGGGMKSGESFEQVLLREIQEETGYLVQKESITEGILVHEKRKGDPDDLLEMDSYYYFCQVSDTAGERNLDDYEAAYDYKVCWMTLEEAIANNESVKNYDNIPWIQRETMVMKNILEGETRQ